MRRAAIPLFLSALAAPLPVRALELAVPGAPELVAEEVTPLGSYALPLAPWSGGALPVRRIEGEVTRQAWRIEGGGIGNLEVIRPLREQLVRQGYSVLLDCDSRVCGGFDFRFATEVLPPPAMQVDLASFRFLSAAAQGPEGEEAVSILVSASSRGAWVQIIQVAPQGSGLQASAEPEPLGAVQIPVGDDPGTPGEALELRGRVVLSDLSFPSGSAQLGEGDYASLASLAAYLLADPARKVALVGHTDTQGALESNVVLSRRRAESVAERLATAHSVPRRQMQAEGVGWLAPATTNLTPEGREANRRVEAVLISDE